MTQYLFLATLGPIQEFIATARRGRDLWFGSWLLSELSKAAARAVPTGQDGYQSLIFPAPTNPSELEPGSPGNVANRIVALVSDPPAEVGERVHAAIQARLAVLRDDAFADRPEFDREVAARQIADLVECAWVAVPLEHEREYPQMRRRLEALMASRKATRDFAAVTWGASVPKSSLDGARESVIPEDAYPTRRDSAERRQEKMARLYTRYRAGPAERLSGVDLLKRLGGAQAEGRVPSTSHIAALPLIERLEQTPEAVRPHWRTYLRELTALGAELDTVPPRFRGSIFDDRDGSLLFEERLTESFEEPYRRQAQQALRTFLNNAAPGYRPLPYYALLLADGDGMGKAIDAQQTREGQRTLSQALDRFASKVRQIVEADHSGALVYAGGDDVLAFVPLHRALACARMLADAFREELRDFGYQSDAGTATPTLSAGITIAHHVEPLSAALELARAAERTAKHVPGKNALAVTVSKRSGADRTVADQWGALDTRLDRFVLLHRRGAIPDGAAYELRDLERRLAVPVESPLSAQLQQALRAEAVRILARKRRERGLEPLAKETLDGLTDMITKGGVDVGKLGSELIVARTLADAANLANMALQTGG